MELTQEQKRAVIKIRQWLNSDKKYFKLCGGPGRGKTTCVREAFDTSVMGRNISHMARLVLSDSIPNSKSYASAVGLTMTYDNDLSLKFSKKKTLH